MLKKIVTAAFMAFTLAATSIPALAAAASSDGVEVLGDSGGTAETVEQDASDAESDPLVPEEYDGQEGDSDTGVMTEIDNSADCYGDGEVAQVIIKVYYQDEMRYSDLCVNFLQEGGPSYSLTLDCRNDFDASTKTGTANAYIPEGAYQVSAYAFPNETGYGVLGESGSVGVMTLNAENHKTYELTYLMGSVEYQEANAEILGLDSNDLTKSATDTAKILGSDEEPVNVTPETEVSVTGETEEISVETPEVSVEVSEVEAEEASGVNINVIVTVCGALILALLCGVAVVKFVKSRED